MKILFSGVANVMSTTADLIAQLKSELKAAGVTLTRDDSMEIVAIFPDKVKIEEVA